MQSSRRAGRDYNTGQEICCANKGEEGDRAATAARGSPPSIRNGPTETQRRDVAVLWFLSAPPASAPEFTPRLFVAAPHPAFSQQPAAAPGAFTLPANVPRRRPRCCCLRPIGATVAHVRRLRVRIAYRSLNNVDVVIGTPTGELPPALGGGAARRPGTALRPLARRSPIAAESAARRGPRGPGPGLSCRGRLGRRDPPGGGGAAPPGARAAGPGRGRPPAGLSIHVLVLPHRRAVAATSPRLRRRRSERATLPAKAVCELIFIHLGTYPVDGTCCKTPIRPSSAATAPTPTKRPSPASPKSATRTSAAPRRARRPGRP